MEEIQDKLARLYAEAADRRSTGNPTGAMARYLQCIAIHEERRDARRAASICLEVADMYYDLCDLAEATRWYERAASGFDAAADRASASRARLGVGRVELLKGDYASAVELYSGELERILERGDPHSEGLARIGLGQALCDSGDVGRGVSELEAGLGCLTGVTAPEAAHAAHLVSRWRQWSPPEPASPKP